LNRAEVLRAVFLEQAEACVSLGSPFMGRLLPLLAERMDEKTPVGAAILNWSGDGSYKGDVVALRIAGGLHGLVLSSQAPDLAAVYPPHEASDDALWAAVERVFETHAERLLKVLKSPPQTNEVRRSAALLPGLGAIAEELGLPIVLSEVGASAGLNLSLDQFALESDRFSYGPSDAVLTLRPDWRGSVPDVARLQIVERQGCDLYPIDLSDEAEKLRLLSYLWADQPERVELTQAAIGVAEHEVVAEHAINFLTRRLMERTPGAVHVVMHSIAWQYFSAADKAEGDAIIAAAGRSASRDAPIARLAMEADEVGPGAALTLQIWPKGETRTLARVDFHGRWVEWLEAPR